jgi:tetratricopeptide (TPR) repeat protein
LTLYHDDIAVSHGLLDPPSTLAALAALLALLVVAVWQRASRPLFTLGVLWFFAGHVLTGTVIPLMLAFEHRNYFPSVGLLLAGASLVAFEGGLDRRRARLALAICAFAFYSFVTWMRAEEWSDPLRLALSEANKRPDSSEAQYELASMLLHSYRKDETEPMIREAYDVLERAYRIPGSDIIHEELLIVGHAQNGQPVDQAWWDSMLRKLRSRPPTSSDISALTELLRCTREGVCKDVGRLSKVFEAAVAHPSPNSVLLSAYGEFAEHLLRNSALAEKLFREALAVAPGEPTTHENLITFLIHHRRFDEAREELDALRRMNHLGSLDPRIEKLDGELSAATASRTGGVEGGKADSQSQ